MSLEYTDITTGGTFRAQTLDCSPALAKAAALAI
jgi:hypothetical protein